jgi:hypothetical protein
MKSMFISVLVAFAAVGSVACSSERAEDSAPVPVQAKVQEGAATVDPQAEGGWRCWRIWWGCASDDQVLTDCDTPNSWTDQGTVCNGCGYTCLPRAAE